MQNKSNKVAEHVQKHVITEYLHMPEHDKRVETFVFRNAKHQLESIEHLGCYKCGTMENRESHHIFERCWANAYDFAKVAFFLFNHYDYHGHVRRDFKSEQELLDWFIKHFNGKPFEYVVELPGGQSETKIGYHCDEEALDTIYNQLILCKAHHRGEGTGIHEESAPTFMALLAMKNDFKNALTPKEYQEMKDKLKQDHDIVYK